ncbi:MAG: hypothetical protein IMF11_18340 [Proteobacteria bacterium]|nr:hypothetical protein [Pseudomonadota bacterium]
MAQLVNAKTTVKGNKLVVEIDLNEDLGPSSTGKTILIAKGKEEVVDGTFLSLNAFKYPPRKVQTKLRKK